MAKWVMLIEAVNATPKNFPMNRLIKLTPALKRYLERDAKKVLVGDMEETVKNWKTKPKMVGEVSNPYGTRLQLTVQPKGRGSTNWKRISNGTGPRTIKAKTPKGMTFPRNYDPKTTPGGSYGGPGRRYGPIVRNRQSVYHTIAPRHFASKIMKKREKKIIADVNTIVRRVGRGSWI